MIYIILFFTHSLAVIIGFVFAAALGNDRRRQDEALIFQLIGEKAVLESKIVGGYSPTKGELDPKDPPKGGSGVPGK